LPNVSVELDIQVPVDEVWERISDFSSYPRFMTNVDEAVELPDHLGNKVTSWQARVKGSVLRWTDESIFDKDNWRIEFFQLEGDLERFDGFWQLESISERMTKVRLSVDFEIGIPQLSALLNPASASAIAENSESMLRDLESRALERIGQRGSTSFGSQSGG
jgi:ribosome-associated toxin RatA of RatAB toxin-antitoxin module